MGKLEKFSEGEWNFMERGGFKLDLNIATNKGSTLYQVVEIVVKMYGEDKAEARGMLIWNL